MDFSFGNHSSRTLSLNSSTSAGWSHEKKKLDISGVRLTKCSVFGPLESGVRSNARFFSLITGVRILALELAQKKKKTSALYKFRRDLN